MSRYSLNHQVWQGKHTLYEEPRGRKLSIKERASTIGLISIVETKKNEKLKMRAIELLHQYDQQKEQENAAQAIKKQSANRVLIPQ